MLADIYNWFTEGIDSADLQDAKALLEELNNSLACRFGFKPDRVLVTRAGPVQFDSKPDSLAPRAGAGCHAGQLITFRMPRNLRFFASRAMRRPAREAL
jgi:hypothetical protein